MMKKLLPFLLILLIACGDQKQSIENVAVVKISTPAPSPTETIKSNTENLKSIINFSSLANKSAAEIEKIYGKPTDIDTKFVQSKNGEFRIYNKDGARFLQVDYFNGKAVAFYLEVPEKLRTQSPDDTLKICGLNLRLSDARQVKVGWSSWEWYSPQPPFYRVTISKFDDSGLYWNCEAHIKV
jgi:hypothetical protein